jgi:hypothetical protein
MRAAGESVYARVQFRKSIGLHQIVIATRFQSFHAIVDAAHRRQEEDRRENLGATQRFDERQSVHLGQHSIDYENVVVGARREVKAIAAIDRMIDSVAMFLETALCERSGFSIVFDKQ